MISYHRKAVKLATIENVQNGIINGNPIVSITDKARQSFIDAGLTYKDITESKFYLLLSLVAKELEHYETHTVKMFISKRLKINMPVINLNKQGEMESAFIKVSSHYFEGREGISFNQANLVGNCWIGFCGWACECNTEPFANAFIKWVELITRK